MLYLYLQDVQSVLAPGIAAAFLIGILWKRASAQGGMWALLSGLIIGLTRLGAKVYYSNAGVEPGVDGSLFQYVFYDCNWMDARVLPRGRSDCIPLHQSSGT